MRAPDYETARVALFLGDCRERLAQAEAELG